MSVAFPDLPRAQKMVETMRARGMKYDQLTPKGQALLRQYQNYLRMTKFTQTPPEGAGAHAAVPQALPPHTLFGEPAVNAPGSFGARAGREWRAAGEEVARQRYIREKYLEPTQAGGPLEGRIQPRAQLLEHPVSYFREPGVVQRLGQDIPKIAGEQFLVPGSPFLGAGSATIGHVFGEAERRLTAVAPNIIRPVVARLISQGGVGALYNTINALVNHHDELMDIARKQGPAEAVKVLGIQAGVGATEWMAWGATMEGLFKVLMFGQRQGMNLQSHLRQLRDRIHPQEMPVSVGSERTLEGQRAIAARVPAEAALRAPIERRVREEMPAVERRVAARALTPARPKDPVAEIKRAHPDWTDAQIAQFTKSMDLPAIQAEVARAETAATDAAVNIGRDMVRPKQGDQVLWSKDGNLYHVESTGPRGVVMTTVGAPFRRVSAMYEDLQPPMLPTTGVAPAPSRFQLQPQETTAATEAGVATELPGMRAKAPAFGARQRELTLGQFVRKQGGINVGQSMMVAGELAGIRRTAQGSLSGWVTTRGVGMSADRMAQLATEAGFRAPDGSPIDSGNISAVLADELRGRPTYSTMTTPERAYELKARAQEQVGWKRWYESEQGAFIPGKIPGIKDLAQSIEYARTAMEEMYGSAAATWAPAEASGVKELPYTRRRNDRLGERAIFALQSQNFHDGIALPILEEFAAKSSTDVRVMDEAFALYLDSLSNPDGMRAAIDEALVKYPDLKPAIERMNAMTPEEKQWAEQTLNAYDQRRGQYLVDNETIEQAREWHVAHMWEETTEGKPLAAVSGRLSPRYRFQGQRVIPTLVEGIAAGLRPRTLRWSEISKLTDLDVARSVMAKGVRDDALGLGVAKWSMSAVPGWVDMTAVSGMRTFRHPVVITGADGVPHAVEQRLYMEPAAAETIRFLYEGDPWRTGPLTGAENFTEKLLRYNSYAKLMELSYSFFHDGNLIRVAAFSRPIYMLRTVFSPNLAARGVYGKWRPVAEGARLIQNVDPMLEKLVRAGMTLGKENIMDAYYTQMGGKARWGMDNAYVRARTKALWQNLQPRLKAWDAVLTVKDALRKFTGLRNPYTKKPWTEYEIFEDVATFADRKWGGLNLDKMGMTRMQRNLLRGLLLAPDWTPSNILLGVSALQGGFHPLMWNTMFSNTVEGWAARQSIAKSVATYAFTLQAVNYLMSGHTTFDNEPGHKLALELPWRSSDGRRLYADWILPGELKDLSHATAGVVTGDVAALSQYVRNKLSPAAHEVLTGIGMIDWAGQPLKKPGMTTFETDQSFLANEIGRALPIPIGLTSLYDYVAGYRDLTQMLSSASGLGNVARGALVPASAWATLPGPYKNMFINGGPHTRALTPYERAEFNAMLRSGRLTGPLGARFRDFYQRINLERQRQRQHLPSEQRFRPAGVHGPRLPPVQP